MDRTYEALLRKTERILTENRYEKDRYPWGKYRMISPGKGHYFGVWNWDSAFHAIGMLSLDKEMAKEQILGFLQFQKADGLLPDVVHEDGRVLDTYTKPPVMAYAAWRVYGETGDKAFLKEVYPALVRNEAFWMNKRQADGMFHYDADREGIDEATYLEHVGWESGWDNSPRWDHQPQDYFAVDLNCFMILTYEALAGMAKELGVDASVWQSKRDALTEKIESVLWNGKIGAYVDFNYKTGEPTTVLTPASFMPLFVRVASPAHAEKMHEIALAHFMPGMPTVSYDDPAYSLDYWRGPSWLNTAYFAAKGLKNYHFDATADELRDTVLGWVANDGEYVHENYDARTGKGLYSENFSWSCVFVREFILHFGD